jgi:hypothetical protein
LQTMNENEAQKGSYRSRSNEINRNKDIVQWKINILDL